MSDIKTTIISNGSGTILPLEALFARLASDPLDPRFEGYGNFILSQDPAIPAGFVRFWGNFFTYAHVFQVETNDPDLIERLTVAIRANQATDAYAAVKAERAAAEAERAIVESYAQARAIVESYADDIPRELAMRAHAGTSFTPEVRGEQERRGYAAQLVMDYDALVKLATSDDKRATLEVEFQRYRLGYRDRYIAMLSSKSRCMSTMITGGSNFPARRNQKRSDAADKRTNELVEYRERAVTAIRKALQPELRPIMSGDRDATERLDKKIAAAEALQEHMRATNVAIRKHKKAGPEAQIAALVAIGHARAVAAQLIQPDSFGNLGYAPYEMTNNNANIRRMKERLVSVSQSQATEATEVAGEHATFEDCPADNRVRLFYPGKPAGDVRARLKSAGFRWTPTMGCWQAYRNHGTLTTARCEAGVVAAESMEAAS